MNALHPLGQLIQSVEDSKGWTVREIARRIERAELNLSNAYLGKLKRKPITAITYDTIHALAVGLDLPERVVGAAALEAMGVHDVNPAEAGAAVSIASDPSLSERDRRVLLAVVREMQREDDDQTEPGGPAAASSGGMEDSTQPDGLTTTGGERDHIKRWNQARPLVATERTARDDQPWTQDDFAPAAKRGLNRGAELRRQQDEAAEEGGS